MVRRQLGILLLLLWPVLLNAQEIWYIDLAASSQRFELRYPKVPRDLCEVPSLCGGVGFGYLTIGIRNDAPDIRDPHVLGVYLLSVFPSAINPAEPFGAEFKIVNTGTTAIKLPVSANLSDLQPADESVKFTYFSLMLLVSAQGDREHPILAAAELYGSDDHQETLLTLQPGEWIRVKAKVQPAKPEYSLSEPVMARLLGGFLLRKNTFTPLRGGGVVDIENLYPNVTATPAVEVLFLAPK